ncbi:MAG TPA: NUDIX domain-containing protein [Candidatus Obscuribacterales bacterium]
MLINTPNLAEYLDGIDEMLGRYLAIFPEDAVRLEVLSDQVAQRAGDLCHRRGLPGHLTASALVLNEPDRTFLLIRHNFLKRWLQPGGHMDAAENPRVAALRELSEEVGRLPVCLHSWHGSTGIPIDIDSHKIPANADKGEPEHLHHDFQYLFVLDWPMVAAGGSPLSADCVAAGGSPLVLQTEEVTGSRWAPFSELAAGEYGQRLARTVNKLVELSLLD